MSFVVVLCHLSNVFCKPIRTSEDVTTTRSIVDVEEFATNNPPQVIHLLGKDEECEENSVASIGVISAGNRDDDIAQVEVEFWPEGDNNSYQPLSLDSTKAPAPPRPELSHQNLQADNLSEQEGGENHVPPFQPVQPPKQQQPEIFKKVIPEYPVKNSFYVPTLQQLKNNSMRNPIPQQVNTLSDLISENDMIPPKSAVITSKALNL